MAIEGGKVCSSLNSEEFMQIPVENNKKFNTASDYEKLQAKEGRLCIEEFLDPSVFMNTV